MPVLSPVEEGLGSWHASLHTVHVEVASPPSTALRAEARSQEAQGKVVRAVPSSASLALNLTAF